MHLLFPYTDSLCLNFGRTAVFQWNQPSTSILSQTTEWPQGIAADSARENNFGGITNRERESQPQFPYVIFRNTEPHFNSYSDTGIPCIKGKTHRLYDNRTTETDNTIDFQALHLLYLLPHLQANDVRTGMESRGRDIQLLAKAIMNKTGQSSVSSPQNPTTQRLLVTPLDRQTFSNKHQPHSKSAYTS